MFYAYKPCILYECQHMHYIKSYSEWFGSILCCAIYISVVCFNEFSMQLKILGKLRKRFIEDFDAKAVALELHDKGIIRDDVQEKIEQNSS